MILKIYMLNKWMIDHADFTQHIAVNKILELNSQYNPTYILVDVGYGGMQIEDLKLTGLQRPETGLQEKVVVVETGGSLTINDIVTGDERRTPVKNFLVESTVRMVEMGSVKMPNEEMLTTTERAGRVAKAMTLLDQMRNYYIDRYTSTGRPVYKGEEDHDLDAFMFCVYGVVTKLIKAQDLYSKMPPPRPKVIDSETVKGVLDRVQKNKYHNQDSVERSLSFSFDDSKPKEEKGYQSFTDIDQAAQHVTRQTSRPARTARRSIGFSFSGRRR